MKYVIIGNGAAGIEAALAIRQQDAAGEITIFTKSPRLHYFRPRLIEYLAGETPLEKFTPYKEDFYTKKNIRNVLDTPIASIDTAAKLVRDAAGTAYPYDRLLIATGGNPFLPPIEGAGKKGVHTLRGVADADNILDCCKGVEQVAVIGGGLLGLETAYSLCRKGKRVAVIEFAKWLLPRQLDKAGGELLQRLLTEKGMTFYTDAVVKSIIGAGDAVEKVVLQSGMEVPAGAVVVSAGIRPDTALAAAAGITVGKGIVVDDNLRTSAADVYAAGDAIEHRGVVYGLWPIAREQGRIAGLNMAGIATAYEGSKLSSVLKITGIDLYSAGNIYDDGSEAVTDLSAQSYKKLLYKSDKPESAIVLGDRDAIKIAQRVMDGKAAIGEFMRYFKGTPS